MSHTLAHFDTPAARRPSLMRRGLRPALAMGTLLLASGLAMAADSLSHADSSFMKDAAKAGNGEIEASQLAQTKAKRDDVKAFAAQMIKDHTATADELKALAASKNVTLSDKASLGKRTKLELIKVGDDDKFDQRYVESFGVKAHEDTVKLFQKASTDAKDADVKAFAVKTLPALQHHLEMARTLQAAVAPSAAPAASR
ncbi:DUF4142 domain-containing protein [Ideonella azotifigens]|uniref:DUF4142 domain-containing protein n=1 Tax=Ideonella azotifigens TaxID=513160 RepID=A0ABP3V6T2_9BURK|nr:DUF4142 domain-containing protein [Ideonella azotifigens]MCD2342759.1 DUF4142 domain-containing protein [Ideonella azotifigens]